jgi:N6-adenosine-specific RNA methylase IME4
MKRYKVILADPAWDYSFGSGSKKGNGIYGVTGHHYSTLSDSQIAAMPVYDLAADNCALFLWSTWPKLPVALEVGKAWGFEYKTLAFDWLKRTSTGSTWHWGTGFWTRANSEPCLLFTRGKVKRKPKSQGKIHQLIVHAGQLELFPPLVTRYEKHSAKPFEQYTRIEALLDGPYLELFARIAYPGWDCWGDQAPNGIEWNPYEVTSQ